MPLSNDPAVSALDDNPDLPELPAAAAELAGARERFMEAVGHSTDPWGEGTEMAAAELLRQSVSISHKLRRALGALMVGYALLWARAHRSETDDLDDDYDLDDDEEPDEFDSPNAYGTPDDLCASDDTDDFRLQALDGLIEKMKLWIDDADKTYEGRSGDGLVRAVVDHRMRLIELDFDPRLLSEPAYRAAVVEAVNAAVGPVARRRQEVKDAWLPEPEPVEEEPEAADDGAGADTASKASGALVGFQEVQLQLARFLAGISRAGDADPVTEKDGAIEEICRDKAAMIEDTCLISEEWLGESLPFLFDCRRGLPAKARLSALTPDDLTEIAGLEDLFLELDMDEDPELEQFPGADLDLRLRFSIAEVAGKLQRREAAREERLSLQHSAKRMRSRMAEVESRTFEGRSRDGLVTARADGSVKLIDLVVDADRLAEGAVVEGDVVEAVNTALDEAAGARTSAGLMMPSG